MRLIAVNSYTATAADGVVAMQDYIVVDQLPPVIAEYARGTVAVPISMLDADERRVAFGDRLRVGLRAVAHAWPPQTAA